MENRTDRLEQYWEQLEQFGLERRDYPDARLRQYRRGDFLCRQGCPIEELLFVVEGRVKVCAVTPADKTLLFCYNGPGTLVGEVELMTGEAATTSLQADCTVRCVALPMKKYAESLRANILFMNRVAHMLAQIVARNAVNDTFNILAPLEARLRAYIAHNVSYAEIVHFFVHNASASCSCDIPAASLISLILFPIVNSIFLSVSGAETEIQ